jgi:hypothetical protein
MLLCSRIEAVNAKSPFSHITDKAPDADTDSAGRGNKHQTFALRLFTPDGVQSPLLGVYVGALWMNDGATIIEIPFGGWLRRADGWQEGNWLATIKGKRLESIYDQITEGRRLSIQTTGPVDDPKKPVVDEIKIQPLDG